MRRYWGLGLGIVLLFVYSGTAKAQLNLTQTYPDAEASSFGFTYTYNSTTSVGKFVITSTNFSAWFTSASSHVSESAATFDMTMYLQVEGGVAQAIPTASLPGGDVDSLLVKGTPSGGSPTDYIDSTTLSAFGVGPGGTYKSSDLESVWQQDSSGTAWPTGWTIGAILFASNGVLYNTPSGQPSGSPAIDFTRDFTADDALTNQANVFPEPSSGALMLTCVFGIARRRRRQVK
jgi:hypothetical protein